MRMARGAGLGACCLLVACVEVNAAIGEDDAAHALARVGCVRDSECGCYDGEGARYQDADECTADLEMGLEFLFEEASAMGLVFDADCLDVYIENVEDVGCKAYEEWYKDAPSCESTCGVYYGTDTLGQPCWGSPLRGSCERGLICWIDGVCTDPCDLAAPIGSPCKDYVCDHGAYCDTVSSDVDICVEAKPLGAACERSEECITLLCEGGTCQTGGPYACGVG